MSTLTTGLSAFTDLFDRPLKKVVLDLGPSPNMPDPKSPHSVLSCFFFANFMVKEIDNRWIKGTVSTAIVPISSAAQPTCTQWHDPQELYLQEEAQSWWEFWGAKGNLLFFIGADGSDGGRGFLVYEFTAMKKVFEDSAELSYDPRWREKKKSKGSPISGLKVITFPDGRVSLRYRRVVGTDCDLRRKQEAACWQNLRSKLDLKTIQMPICDYRGINPSQEHYASAIAYPMEVSLSPQPITRSLPGPVGCWPVD